MVWSLLGFVILVFGAGGCQGNVSQSPKPVSTTVTAGPTTSPPGTGQAPGTTPSSVPTPTSPGSGTDVATRGTEKSTVTTTKTAPSSTSRTISAPSAPKDVVVNVTATSLTVSWTEPEDPNGPLEGYNVTWAEIGKTENSTETPDTSVVIDGLKPYTEYEVKVRAFNALPSGGVLVSAEAVWKNWTWPDAPSPPKDVVVKVTSRSLNVSWTEPDEPNGPLEGYKVTWAEMGQKENSTETTDTSVVIDGLKPYTEYEVKMRAFNKLPTGGDLESQDTAGKHRTWPDAPSPPQNISVQATPRSLNVSWTAPKERNGPLTGYKVEVTEKGAKIKSTQTTEPNTIIDGLKPYTEYEVRVLAFNKPPQGKDIESEDAVSKHWTWPDAPSPPQKLGTTAVSDTTVTVTWEQPDHVNGILGGYRVFWRTDNTNDTEWPGVKGQTTATLTGLKPYTTYTITVRAYNSQDKKTLLGEPASLTTNTTVGTPSSPRDVVVKANATSLTVSWTRPEKPNGPLTGYKVELTEKGKKINSTETTDTSVVIDGLKPYTEYEVKVRAFNKLPMGRDLESQDTVGKHRTWPDAPSPPKDVVVNVTATSLTVSWTEPDEPNGPLKGYKVTWAEIGQTENSTETTDTSVVIDGLKPYTEYEVKVRAFNKLPAGKDLESQDAVSRRRTWPDAPSPPKNLQTTGVTDTTMTITWEQPDQANGVLDGYKVYWRTDDTNDTEWPDVKRGTTSATLTSLKPYTKYTITLRAYNSHDKKTLLGEPASLTANTTVGTPSPPKDIVIEATATSLTVSWTEPEEPNGPLEGYKVTWAEIGQKENSTETTNTSLFIDGLKPYTEYEVKVRAFNELPSGEVLLSTEAVWKNWTWPSAPSAVMNLRSTTVGSNFVKLEWDAPLEANGPLDFYRIVWSLSGTGKSVSETGGIGRPKVNHTITGLQPWFNYTIHVTACNRMPPGNKDANEVCGQNETTEVQTDVDAPGPVTELMVMSKGSKFLDVSWKEPTVKNGPLSSYEIRWTARTGVNETRKLNFTEGSNAYSITHLKPWTNYSISVRACNIAFNKNEECGEYVPLVGETDVDAPSAPTSVSCRPGSRTISLEWEAPKVHNGPIDGYLLQLVGPDGQKDDNPKDFSVTGTEYEFTKLEPYSQYIITVSAYNRFNDTCLLRGEEHSISDRTKPERPGRMEEVRVKAFNNNSVRLTWKIPSKPRGILRKFFLQLNDTKGDGGSKDQNFLREKVCNGMDCEHLFTGLHAERDYKLDVRGINEGVDEYGEPPLQGYVVSVPPGNPPRPKNISRAEDVVEDNTHYDRHTEFRFYLANDTFDDFNGAIVDYEVIASESSSIEQDVSETLTWGEVISKDVVAPYRASPRGWNPFKPAGNNISMPCSNHNGKMVCVLGRQECTSNTEMPCNGPLKPGKSYAMYIRGYTKGGHRATTPLHFSTEPLPSDGGAIAGGVIGGLIIGLILIAAAVYSRRFRIAIGRQKPQTNGSLKGERMTDSRLELVRISRSNGVSRKSEPTAPENVEAPAEDESAKPIVHEPKGPIKKSEFCAYMADMEKDYGYKFVDEYERLVELSPHYRSDAARDPANSKKNRFTNIHPFDKNRVPLSEINGDPHSSYINASFIQGFNGVREYIAAQGPNVTTINDFWRMICEHDVRCIVMLTQCVEGNKKKCEQYWPDEEQTYGDVQVKKNSLSKQDDYIVTQFSVKSDDSSHPRTLHHVFFTAWPDHGVPETPAKLINFVRVCQEFFGPRTGNQPPIVVHCSAGVGRTGTFIALDYLLQLLSVQESVNIFNLVLQLREDRRCMVQNESQYIYLHKCVKAVLEGDNQAPTDSLTAEPIYENVDSIRDTKACQL